MGRTYRKLSKQDKKNLKQKKRNRSKSKYDSDEGRVSKKYSRKNRSGRKTYED